MIRFLPTSAVIFSFVGLILLLQINIFKNKETDDKENSVQTTEASVVKTPKETPALRNNTPEFPQVIRSIKVPAAIEFAGEKVPVHIYDVHDRLDRELLVNTFWHSNTLMLFKLANRYFPVIEPILKQHGVPEDFKYIALIESGLRNVVSPSNAAGVWQFLEGTAKEHNLEVTEEVDERYHLEKSTIAAAEYFKKSKARLGSWTLAAAAYNMGLPGIQAQLEQQKVTNYYDLHLNSETSRYILRAVAMKALFETPELYGFYLGGDDLYDTIPYRTITINSAITDLPAFALENKTNYKMLRLLNPWLRKPTLENKQTKTYVLKLPA